MQRLTPQDWPRLRAVRLRALDLGLAVGAPHYDREGEVGFTPTGRTGAFPEPRQHITEHELQLEL